MMKVADIMTRDVVTLEPEQNLEEAARILMEEAISGAPVVKEGKVIGMLSERDLLSTRTDPRPPRYLELLGGIIFLDNVKEFQNQLKRATATKVEELMTSEVVVTYPESSLDEAAQTIIDQRVNRLPVVDDEGILIGIVTRNDVLRGILEQ